MKRKSKRKLRSEMGEKEPPRKNTSTRFSREELREIDQAAKRLGLSRTQFIRSAAAIVNQRVYRDEALVWFARIERYLQRIYETTRMTGELGPKGRAALTTTLAHIPKAIGLFTKRDQA